MKRLTDGMKNEMHTINQRTESLYDQYMGNVLGDQYFYMLYRLNAQHGDELESYKVKLENFYSETDVKEQTFQDYTTWDYKEQDCFPVTLIRWNILSSKRGIWSISYGTSFRKKN